MVDRNGNPIVVGEDYVLVAPAVENSAGRVTLDTRPRSIVVEEADLIRAVDVGSGGGGATDHGALTGLADPDHPAGAVAFTGTDRLLGRATAGAGAGEEITCTAAGRALLDDADAAAQRATLSVYSQAAVDAVVAELLRRDGSNAPTANIDWDGYRITGMGDPVGIADAATAGWSLTQFALLAQNLLDIPDKGAARTNLGLGGAAVLNVGTTAGTVAAGDHGHTPDDVSFASTDRLLGRATAGPGAGEEITCTAAGRALLDDADAVAQRGTLGLGTMAVQADAPSDGTLYGRKNAAWEAVPSPILGALASLDQVDSAEIVDGAVTADKLDGQTKQRLFEECLNFANGLATWSGVVSGTGAMGQQKPRYSTSLQANGQLFGARVTTAGGTTGTNAAAMYLNTLPLWLANGFGMSGKALIEAIGDVSVLRWGFIGNDVAPTSTGAPAYGVWFSVDPGTYGDNVVRVHTANGGAVTTTSTGITAAAGTVYAWAIEFESTSSVKFYFGTSMPLTPTATHTTNIPSGNQPRQGAPFAQIVKINPASTAWSGLIIPFWRIHLDPARHDERYA